MTEPADRNRRTHQNEEVMKMGFKKHGTGEVIETEGDLSRTASGGQFTPADQEALDRENAAADRAEPTEED